MHIFDNILWEKLAGEEHLWIDKPKYFAGKDDNSNIADLQKANKVGDYDALNARLEEVHRNRFSSKHSVRLADNDSMLRGYGGGLAILGMFQDAGPFFYLPFRGTDAPGDRLIWDVCAGRTVRRGESPHWLHRMVAEGLEEITFLISNMDERTPYLVTPYVTGLDFEVVDDKEAKSIVMHNADALGLKPEGFLEVPLRYIPPKNAVHVHQVTEDGSEVQFKAGWGIEAKYSGLELMAYGMISFGHDYSYKLKVYDSEEFAPGKVCEREVHEVRPDGSIFVFHKGNVKHETNVNSVIARRDFLRGRHDYFMDRLGQVPIPEYPASIKADMLTSKEAWPFDSRVDMLRQIQFRG